VKLSAGKVYCLADTQYAGCAAVIAPTQARKAADQPLWDECHKLGQKAFNQKYAAQKSKQRDHDCAYELHATGGPNARGERWARLLPAACQSGAYVGRDGTDCCDRPSVDLA
jgi:hypothetical protein